MDIEYARNIGAAILLTGAVVLGIFVASTDIKSWEDKDGHHLGQEQTTTNNAILLRIAAVGFVVFLSFVGVALVHFS